MKLLSVQFYLASPYPPTLMSKYSPQDTVLKHPSQCSSFNARDTFHFRKANEGRSTTKYVFVSTPTCSCISSTGSELQRKWGNWFERIISTRFNQRGACHCIFYTFNSLVCFVWNFSLICNAETINSSVFLTFNFVLDTTELGDHKPKPQLLFNHSLCQVLRTLNRFYKYIY
jgi:hypothetical protein